MGWVNKGEATPQKRRGGWVADGKTFAPSDSEILEIVGNPMYLKPTYKEWEAYAAAKERQDIPIEDYLPRMLDAGGMVLGELWSGIKETAKTATGYAEGDVLPSLGEAFIRGTTDIEILARKGILDPMNLSGSGPGPAADYDRFIYNRYLENLREKARRGDQSMMEYFGYASDESINPAMAEGWSYVLDPTLVIGGWGAAGKAGAKVTAKSGSILERVAGKAAQGIQKASDLDWVQKVGTTGKTLRRASGVAFGASGNMMLAAGIYAPELLATTGAAARLVEQIGKQLKLGPSQFSVLERIVADETIDIGVRKAAKVLYAKGYGQAVFNGMGAVTAGTGLGVGIGGGLGYLAEGEEGFVAGVGAGAAVGGVGGAIGKAISTVVKTPAKLAAENRDIDAFIERQVKDGMDKEKLKSLDRATLIQAATLDGVNTGTTKVKLAGGEQYYANVKRRNAERGTPDDAVGAAFYDKAQDTIWVNLDEKAARWNMLHEFGHALFYSPVVDRGKLVSELHLMYGPEQLGKMGDEYARSIWLDRNNEETGGRIPGVLRDKVNFKPEKDADGVSIPENIEHNKKARETLDGEKEGLTRDLGDDWLVEEIFAEEFASLSLTENINQLRRGQSWTGQQLEGLKGEILKVKSEILQRMGVEIDPSGFVKGTSLIFESGVASTPKMQRTIKNFMRDRAQYHSEITKPKKQGGAVMDVKDMGDHPAAGWRDRGDGTFENDFAIKDKEGRVTEKTGDAIGRALWKRAKETVAIIRGTKDTPIDRSDPILGYKAQDDGKVTASGEVLPKEIYELASYSQSAKEFMQTIENSIALGTTFKAWYQQLSTSRSGRKRPKKEIDLDSEEHTAKMWHRNARKWTGNMEVSSREFKPIGFEMSDKGNLNVKLVDVGMVGEKMARWKTEKDANGRYKLIDWNNDTVKFEQDMMTYLKNQGEGKPGATGIGEHKRDVFRAFLQLGGEGINPLKDLYHTTSFDRASVVKSFRIDRLQNLTPTSRKGFHFPYYKIKGNLIPSTRNISPQASKRIDGALAKPEGKAVEVGMPSGARMEPEQPVAQVGNAFVTTDPGLIRIPAFHASPSKFNKFDMDHMGGGQGFQLYGWGLYFSANKRGPNILKELFEEGQKAGTRPEPKGQASLYEVDLKIDPDDVPEWNAPVSEQKGVVEKLGKIDEVPLRERTDKPGTMFTKKIKGASKLTFGEWYDAAKMLFAEEFQGAYREGKVDKLYPEKRVSQYLLSKGIRGVKFETGLKARPGRNYVVFDSNDITVKKRNGEEITPKEAARLMPRASSQTTQRANTVATYEKAYGAARNVNRSGGKRVLDYAAGLGAGTRALRNRASSIESYEPFPSERWMDDSPPTHTEAKGISGKFDTVLNLNTLNVLEPADRTMVVRHIGEVLEENGVAIFQARDAKAVMGVKSVARYGDEPNSVWIEKNFKGEKVEDYQKGFEQTELEDYIGETLGLGFDVKPARGLSGVAVTAQKKLNEVSLMPRGMFSREVAKKLGDVTGGGYKKAFTVDYIQTVKGGREQKASKTIAGMRDEAHAQQRFDAMVKGGREVKNFKSQVGNPKWYIDLPVLDVKSGGEFPNIAGGQKFVGEPKSASAWDKTNSMIDMGIEYANTMPGKGTTDAEWRKVAPVMFYRTGIDYLPPAPSQLAKWVKSPQAFQDFVVDATTHSPQLLATAIDGLNSLTPIHEMAAKGKIPEEMVALHMMWGLLSRSLDPFNQEVGWSRMAGNTQVLDAIEASIAGKYKMPKSGWDALVKETMGFHKDAPEGRNATMNSNAYHAMLENWNGRWDELTGIINQTGFSGPQMRRSFFREGFGGAGIKHKVLSFVLATLARRDVWVGDRWQVVNFWMPHLQKAATERGKKGGSKHVFRYEESGTPVDTTQAYKTYGPFMDKPGVGEGVYSLIENGLETIAESARPWLEPILGRRPEAFDIHWITWNTIKKEPVGHSSLDATNKFLQEGRYDLPDYKQQFAAEPKSTERHIAGTEGQYERVTVAGRGRPESTGVTRETNPAIRRLGESANAGGVQGRPSLIPRFEPRPGFEHWFGRSKVTEADGITPRVVFHGTTHEFNKFEKGKGGHRSDDNDMGNGNYFTSSPEDASSNYAGVHTPDRDNWISAKAEELESSYNIDYTTAYNQAKSMLSGQHEGAVIPTYLRMENPLEIKDKGGTFFDYEVKYDGDNYIGEEGRGVELIETIRDVAERYEQEGLDSYGELDAGRTVSNLGEIMLDYGGVTARAVAESLKKDSMASGQFVQDVFAQMGYDGIIDSTVAKKFKGMNLRPGTKHYIAFESDQIKGALNREFDASKGEWNLMPRGDWKVETIGDSKVLSKGRYKGIETRGGKWRVYNPSGKLIGVSGTEKAARQLIARKAP